MKKNILIALAALVAIGGQAGAVTFSKVGTAGAQFLKLGAGARAVGMGEAFTAVVDDATAMYWNPAGLAQAKKQEMTFTHNQWLGGIKHEFIGYCLPLGGNGTLGMNLTVLNVGEMPVTTVERGEETGEFFTCMDWAFALGYGRNLTDKVAFGATAKVIQQRIWDMKASAFAMDLGISAKTGYKSLRIAAALLNFGTDIQYKDGQLIDAFNWHDYGDGPQQTQSLEYVTSSSPLPLSYRLGLGYDLIDNPTHKLTGAFDYVHPNDGSEKQNLGVEYGFNKMLFARAGLRIDIDARYDKNAYSPTFGMGVDYGFGMLKTKIDYAFADYGPLSTVHRIALALIF
ncbi:PorV/PorQ family protein [candidate division TA06 bacterium]|uniref:PorV/PorQ family protein n=1 Tax=candidate division TA06 bacterium TaxID=2250710 RepID=A0A933ML63_UNCT6|nr:PorV/PorQ family protein [candidate division TA06 bacterium]